MPYFHPAYPEHERKRFRRHDAHRFIRPDWRRFVQPGSALACHYAELEAKYRPDQPRVPAGSSEGGQWTDDLDQGAGSPASTSDTGTTENIHRMQFTADDRSLSSEQLIRLGGEDLGSFGDGVSIVKGPDISHQESFDPVTGATMLSFTGVGTVVVDERVGKEVSGSSYTVGTPTRPDDGLSIIINRNGRVRAHPTIRS